jgi:hypothetical protein
MEHTFAPALVACSARVIRSSEARTVCVTG